MRIQDLRSASVAVASRTSSPDADVQQCVLEDVEDIHTQPGMTFVSELRVQSSKADCSFKINPAHKCDHRNTNMQNS